MKNDKKITGHEDCTGCAVCLLSCPVWRQTHDLMMTNAGRARALQAGASPEELAGSAEACLLCGSCAPVCPSRVDTLALTTRLRAASRGAAPETGGPAAPAFRARGRIVFLPGPALRSEAGLFAGLKERLEGHGCAVPPGDELSELASAMDEGTVTEPPEEVIAAFSGASGFIAAEGSLLRHLRRWFPYVRSKSLGEHLLEDLKTALRPGDLYVVDARAFNSDHARLVRVYDRIRLQSGCAMSTSLQRAGMPVVPQRPGGSFDSAEQARWVLGRARAERVIAESFADLEAFRRASKVPVIHVSEL